MLLCCQQHPFLLLLLVVGCAGPAALMQRCAARLALSTTLCAEFHHSHTMLPQARRAWQQAVLQQSLAWLHRCHAQG
jgi:hypothetical protein